MKCALVIPAWSPAEIFSSRTAASQINYWQPLGTLYVAASLRQAGHEVRFFNGAFQRHDEILSGLASFAPRIVGLYATAFGWRKAVRAAAEIRRVLPGTFIVAGGPYPSYAGAQCLPEAPEIDAVVVGEAEDALVELADRLRRGEDLAGLPGVAFRCGSQVVENPPRSLNLDLDRLPFPARDLLGDAAAYVPPPATYRRAPVAVMITSRGCNRRCIFCFQMDRARRHGIRYRGVDNVIAEIRHLVAEGYREIKFLDDTLAADRARALEIARRIRAERLDIAWFASACVHQVDRELLEAFRAAGCWAVLFGAESGVQRNLDALRKGITLEQTQRAVRAARAAGLAVHTPFIFGIPGQTWEEGLETIRFACKLDPDIASFHALTPFPGSELWERRHELGTVAEDLGAYTYQGAAFVPHTLTREQIQELRQRAYRTFYSRPRYLVRRTLGIRSLHEVAAAWRGARSLLGLWTSRRIFARDKAGPWGPAGGNGGQPAC
jgi:anaerobic magnesium-protoporphyrin IX monomethyl ester cyclase